MVDHQVIACPVAHQHVTVGIQNVAPGGFHTGTGGKGGGIVSAAAGFDHLQVVELEGEKRQHHRKDQHQQPRPKF